MWPFQPLLPAAAQQQGATGSAGTAAGTSTASGDGAADVRAAGSVNGAASANAVGVASIDGAGAAAGTSAATGGGASYDDGAGASSGSSTAAAASASDASTGTATGMSVASGVGAADVRAVGSSAGAAAAAAVAATSISAGGTSARLAVQKAVYEAAQIALAPLGVSVFDHPPHGRAFPFVVFDQHQTLPLDGSELDGFQHHFYLSVWSDYRGSREVETILAALWRAYHNQRLILEAGTFVLCQVTDQRNERDFDGVTYHGSMTLTVITNPPANN